jgi:hypothetical protein
LYARRLVPDRPRLPHQGSVGVSSGDASRELPRFMLRRTLRARSLVRGPEPISALKFANYMVL